MSLYIFIVVSILLITSIIIKPKIKIFDTYVLVAVIGALLMVLCRSISFKEIYTELFKNPLISPIKILVLFFTMTFISVVCDNLGFFNFLAYKALKLGKGSQYILFTIFFVLISIVTIFTSNDIIILTFTPFIIYFTRRSKISITPYLVMEFMAANTASMMLIVGNPTNILLSLSAGINFLEYFKNMWLTTTLTSIFLYLLLILIFHKKLSEPLQVDLESKPIKLNIILTTFSISCLLISTIMLAISNYINIEMYLITLTISIILFVFLSLYVLITKKEKQVITNSFKRLPYSLIFFLISMFIMVSALKLDGYTLKLYNLLNHSNEIYTYGISSFIFCNLMNNIPMSVLYSNVLSYGVSSKVIYATIISSNIGAYLTPLGALAGIMWMSILKIYDVDFKFKDFTKYGLISIPVVLFSLTILYLV